MEAVIKEEMLEEREEEARSVLGHLLHVKRKTQEVLEQLQGEDLSTPPCGQ